MTTKISTSFAEFNPKETIERISFHLKRIEIIKKETKEKWITQRIGRGKYVGFWPFYKWEPLTIEEAEDIWDNGVQNSFYTPKERAWEKLELQVARFKNISDFCQLAIEQGNKTVYLSKEDALFAFNWQ